MLTKTKTILRVRFFSTKYLGLSLLIILCLYTRLINNRVPGDDAFMTFKLARNFGDSLDFFYNPGEFVYGTSPLYTVIIGLIYRIFNIDPIYVSKLLNTSCDCFNLILFCLISKRAGLNTVFSLLATYSLCMSWLNINSSTLGMETPVFLIIFLLIVYLYQKSSSLYEKRIGILLGLLFLTRPEGVFLFISLVISQRVLLQRKIFNLCSIYFSIIGMWLFFSYYKFGYFFPPSIESKNLAYFRYPFSALINLLIYPQKFFFVKEVPYDFQLLSVISVSILVGISFYYFVKNNRKNFLIFGFYLLFFLAYSYKNPFIFPWYIVPYEICAILSINYIVQVLCTDKNFYFRRISRVFGVLLALWLIIFPLLRLSNPLSCRNSECGKFLEIPKSTTFESRSNVLLWWDLASAEREEIYIKLAKEFFPTISNSSIVLAPEFGAFGYYSDAKIVSSIGHISPEVFKFLPISKEILVINTAIPVDMVKEIKPDYLLSLEVFIRKSLLIDKWFIENYQILKKEDSKALSSNGLYLFKKKQYE